MKIVRVVVSLGACVAALSACSSAQPQGDDNVAAVSNVSAATSPADAATPQHLAKVALLIRHREGAADTRLNIEIALSTREQERGLMHRIDLKPGDGMIFPMLPARTANFWMKNTPTPLDILFIRTDGSIERIAQGKPNDLTPLFVEIPVAGVLELRGGDAKRLGIGEGDRVAWGACATSANPRPVSQAENFCPG